jgi:hypothetical protein
MSQPTERRAHAQPYLCFRRLFLKLILSHTSLNITKNKCRAGRRFNCPRRPRRPLVLPSEAPVSSAAAGRFLAAGAFFRPHPHPSIRLAAAGAAAQYWHHRLSSSAVAAATPPRRPVAVVAAGAVAGQPRQVAAASRPHRLQLPHRLPRTTTHRATQNNRSSRRRNPRRRRGEGAAAASHLMQVCASSRPLNSNKSKRTDDRRQSLKPVSNFLLVRSSNRNSAFLKVFLGAVYLR